MISFLILLRSIRVYTKTIIIFNRSENWPKEYLLRREIFATINLDLKE